MYVLNVPRWKWILTCLIVMLSGAVNPMIGYILVTLIGLHWAILFINAGNIKVIEKIVLLGGILAIIAYATLSLLALATVAMYGIAMAITAAEEQPLIIM